MEAQIRAKKAEIKQTKLAVKQAAHILAASMDQKRRLKKAAKKILMTS